jgi:putative DNA primase/helicase
VQNDRNFNLNKPRLDAATLAERLDASWDGARFMALCPVHEDTNPSLSLQDGERGVVLHCFACTANGMSQQDYLDAFCQVMGIVPQQLFFSGASAQHIRQEANKDAVVVAEYDYCNEAGTLLFQAVRYAPKRFRQRRPDGNGGWIPNLATVRRVLYRLPELIAGVATGQTVYIVEGEKDVERLRALGVVATCNPMGAGKWQEAYSEPLAGAQVVILPDNDAPGRQHAQQVARSLYGTAARVTVLPLPGLLEKGDVSDWLEVSGNTREVLEQLVRKAPTWTPPAASAEAQIASTVAKDWGGAGADDEGNAQAVKARHGDRFLWCDALGWMAYTGTH